MKLRVELSLAPTDRVLLEDIAASLREMAGRQPSETERAFDRKMFEVLNRRGQADASRLTVSTPDEITRLTIEEMEREQSGLTPEEWRKLHAND